MPLSDGLITVLGEAAVEPAPLSVTPSVAAPTPSSAAEPTPSPTLSPTAQPAAGGGIYYIVQPGENLFRVGLKFGSTAQAIATASNIADPGQVQAGTMVLVPVPPPQGGYGYYVQPRDTVYSIARRFGMTVGELTSLNGIGPDYHIEVGQILVVTP
jgi:LysM repeat protein